MGIFEAQKSRSVNIRIELVDSNIRRQNTATASNRRRKLEFWNNFGMEIFLCFHLLISIFLIYSKIPI